MPRHPSDTNDQPSTTLQEMLAMAAHIVSRGRPKDERLDTSVLLGRRNARMPDENGHQPMRCSVHWEHLLARRAQERLEAANPCFDIDGWAKQAREHWQEHRPSMCRALEENDRLEPALQRAAIYTAREMNSLMAAGQPEHEAWAMVREQYLFLPEEDGLYDEEPTEQAQAIHDALRGLL